MLSDISNSREEIHLCTFIVYYFNTYSKCNSMSSSLVTKSFFSKEEIETQDIKQLFSFGNFVNTYIIRTLIYG